MSLFYGVMRVRCFVVEASVHVKYHHRYLINAHILMTSDSQFNIKPRALAPEERIYYRDRFRDARYAALADSEGFGAICFALEAFGLRLLGARASLEGYKGKIAAFVRSSLVLSELSEKFPSRFKTFEALFVTVQNARNDAMHLGAYARHATAAAIELCIGLEEALMAGVNRTVGNLMVTSPVSVQPWQPIAHARQLMLMHSFSFLPVRLGHEWCLISELCLAKYLGVNAGVKKIRLGETIEEGAASELEIIKIPKEKLLHVNQRVTDVLKHAQVESSSTLWLVVDENRPDHLAGVLSPFELM